MGSPPLAWMPSTWVIWVKVLTLRTEPMPLVAGKNVVLLLSAPSSVNTLPDAALMRNVRLFKRPQPLVTSTMSPLV